MNPFYLSVFNSRLRALFGYALSDYTRPMMKGLAPLLLASLAVAPTLVAQERSPREIVDALNALRLENEGVYQISPVNRIELERGGVRIAFDEGRLAFFSAFDGRINGAVFSGKGHVLAAPRDVVEKQQLGFFLGAPLLDQDFFSAYMRFTDDTAEVLEKQIQASSLSPQPDGKFVESWNSVLARLNPVQAMRLLSQTLSANPRPYFYAEMDGMTLGPFDVIVDPSREEAVLLGQLSKAENGPFYNVWASYRLPDVSPPRVAFHPESYVINTSIHTDNSVEGSTELRIRAQESGERLILMQLSRDFQVDAVTKENDQPLIWFHNSRVPGEEHSRQADDLLYVVLPQPSREGDSFVLKLRYHGNVIHDAGNGVYFVSDRDSWYPRLGGNAEFSTYDLTMRWPRRLRLTATGTKLEEKEEGEFRVGRWRVDKPVSVAGFNLGDYAFASFPSEGYSVDVYANKQLEQALLNRLRVADAPMPTPAPFGMPRRERLDLPAPSGPSPAAALKQLGKEIDSSIQFYERYCGAFPFRQLSVSQIPGSFGQGWPGLLYLSTYSFLPVQAQMQVGLSANTQEHFNELVPFHEVAHQWWGNIIGWSSYRDQWIDEAFANYLAMLFADSQKNPDRKLRIWLERYRDQLNQKTVGADVEPAEYGSLTLGNRLTSSKSPDGFERVIYAKGSWVIHMIREMLRQPGTKDPDARFVALMRAILEKYSFRPFSTADFQHEVERVMTPAMDIEGNHSMDWFFDEWVRGIGIPRYRIEYTAKKTEKGFAIRGKIYQTRVPRSFVMPVPLYASDGTLIGRVIAGGPETTFHLTSKTAPGKIAIDPHRTILCVVEH